MSWSQRKTDTKWHQDWLPSNYSKNDQESEDNVQQPPFWNYRCTRHSTDSTPPHGPGPQPSDEVTPVAKSLLGNLKDGSLLCTLCSFACTRISSGFGKNVCSTAEKLKKSFFQFWVLISLQRTSLSTNSVSQSKYSWRWSIIFLSINSNNCYAMLEQLDYISDRSVLLPLFSKMFIFISWKIDIKRLWIVSMDLFYKIYVLDLIEMLCD